MKLMREVFGEKVKVISYGNSAVATAFIQGLSEQDIDENLFKINDTDYAIVIGIVAEK